jgi:hypothetical protein
MIETSKTSKSGMEKAYQIAQEMVRDQLREKNPEAAQDLENIHESDIIVTRGQYDFIEKVLNNAGTPNTLVHNHDLEDATLRPDQVLFVNCPGKFKPRTLRKMESFVKEGGFLFTTDWALKNVLEPAFPGYVEFNQNSTADEVVRVEIIDKDDPYLNSLMGPEDDPQWWLEGSSYPIKVLNPDAVKILVTSKEIEQKYGDSPVLVSFEYGEGKIYHMISHFYLQRSETRTARHRQSGRDYCAEKGISPSLRKKYEYMGASESSLGDIESAYSSSVLWNRVFVEKKQHDRERRRIKEEALRREMTSNPKNDENNPNETGEKT